MYNAAATTSRSNFLANLGAILFGYDRTGCLVNAVPRIGDALATLLGLN